MTKKEQARLAVLRHELALAKALRWTEPVEPDVQPPVKGLSVGYTYIGDRVEPARSSVVFHAVGRQDKTDSQGCRSLYSTRLLALKALRHAVEKDCAEKLARIDDLIVDLTDEEQG